MAAVGAVLGIIGITSRSIAVRKSRLTSITKEENVCSLRAGVNRSAIASLRIPAFQLHWGISPSRKLRVLHSFCATKVFFFLRQGYRLGARELST
jgi:hypothetical protein